MSAFFANYPPIVVSGGGGGSATAANQVLEIAQLTAINANTVGLATEATLSSIDGKIVVADTGNVTVIASALPTGASTSALQTAGNASLSSIDTKLTAPLSVTGPLTDAELRASAVPVSLAAVPLPSGAATAANQATEIASLASIDGKLTSPLVVTGPLTDTELRASAVPVAASALPLPTGAATAANQATEIASLASIDTKLTSPLAVTGPLTDTELRASAVPVSVASVPLPTGAATAANQTNNLQTTQIVDAGGQATTLKTLATQVVAADIGIITASVIHGVTTGGGGGYVDVKVNPSGALTVEADVTSSVLPTGAATSALQTSGNASLTSIDSKLTAPLAVTGPLTDTELRASAVPVSVASIPLPSGAATEATLAAFSDKTAAALVPEAFDYQDITYVGATTDINTVVYKLGGSGGTTVATLTMGYDGSNRLTSVTRT